MIFEHPFCYHFYMKLSQYAKKYGIHYTTAYRLWKNGHLKGKQLPTGTILLFEEQLKESPQNRAVLYARVSSSENKSNLETQLSRLRDYASAKGYTIVKEIKEVGSGLNDKRPYLEKVFTVDNWDILIVEHKDRLARFGTNYISLLFYKLFGAEKEALEVYAKHSVRFLLRCLHDTAVVLNACVIH